MPFLELYSITSVSRSANIIRSEEMFGFKFLISWCWETHHSCFLLYSSVHSGGCCNASYNTGKLQRMDALFRAGFVCLPQLTHTWVHAWERPWMHRHIHTSGVFYISLNHITLAKGDLKNSLWSSAQSCSSLSLTIFFLTETDYNST